MNENLIDDKNNIFYELENENSKIEVVLKGFGVWHNILRKFTVYCQMVSIKCLCSYFFLINMIKLTWK